MKKKLITGISAFAGLIIATVIVGTIIIYPISPLRFVFLVASAEEVDRYEIALAKNASRREPASKMVDVDGIAYELPLPNGATPDDDSYPNGGTYMICSDELRPYLDSLPSQGYSFIESMGSMYFYKNDALDMRLEIGTRQFSHSFYIVHFNLWRKPQ